MQDELFPESYNISIPGFTHNIKPGEPSWLCHWDTFEIPQGYTADVRLVNAESVTFDLNLAPARIPLPDDGVTGHTPENVLPVAGYEGWLPSVPVESTDVKVYRDRNILYVGVFPLSYNYSCGQVKVDTTLSYDVVFNEVTHCEAIDIQSKDFCMHDVDDDFMALSFDHTVDLETMDAARIVTPPYTDPISLDGFKEAPYYLILSTPDYQEEVERFAAWKRILGFNTETVYRYDWTSESIMATVKNFYLETPGFQYLLLFGNGNDLPGVNKTSFKGDSDYSSDHPYTCMDGEDDMLSDITCGRISMDDPTQANDIIDKIIKYENKEYPLKLAGIHCAFFEDIDQDGYEDCRFTETAEDIARGYEGMGRRAVRYYLKEFLGTSERPYAKPSHWTNDPFLGYGLNIPEYLEAKNFKWNPNDVNKIINILGEGATYALYRGHGSVNKWYSLQFDNSCVAKINGLPIPIVFSITCSTGRYYGSGYYSSSYSGPSLAEAFLNMKDSGGIGVIAASETTYSGFNDAMTMDMFQCMWPESEFLNNFGAFIRNDDLAPKSAIRQIGRILDYGKEKLMTHYTDVYKIKGVYVGQMEQGIYAFHCFGDPSMKICDQEPQKLSYSVKVHQSIDGSGKAIDIRTSQKCRMVKVNKATQNVTNSIAQQAFSISDMDLYVNDYYFIADNIAPTHLDQSSIPMLSYQPAIEKIEQMDNMLNVSIFNPEQLKTDVVMQDCNSKDSQTRNEVRDICDFNLSPEDRSIKIIYLLEDGVIKDCKKIILK